MKTKKVLKLAAIAALAVLLIPLAFTACADSITIGKTDPAVTWPQGLTATAGQKLADITLPANTGTAGQFTWTNPAALVGTAGQRTHNMTFTPANTVAYNTLTNNVTITVSQTYTFTDGDGNTYELEITGDGGYVLIVTDSDGGSKTSTGTVTDDGNGTLTLAPDADPDNTFTVSVDDTGITGMEGEITFDDETTTEAPEIVTPTPTYAVTVTNGTVENGGGTGDFVEGATVTITANTPPAGQKFKNWTTESANVTFADANSASTTFTMPANTVTVVANFEPILYTVTVTNGAVENGGGTGDYAQGALVTITADEPEAEQYFKNWTTESAGVIFADVSSASTTFTMPANAVTVVANFATSGGTPTYVVTVIDGAGGGNYEQGEIVTITANTPPAGQKFVVWTTDVTPTPFANVQSVSEATTTFTMPASAVTVTANFGPYAFGDTGPGGGIIFYFDANGFEITGYGDPGDANYFAPYTAHYFEVNPTDLGYAYWGGSSGPGSGVVIPGVTTPTSGTHPDLRRIGNGRKDTALIVAYLAAETTETGRAAQICDALTEGGMNDWFLPSIGELIQLYQRRVFASITSDTYWSSSQIGIDSAFLIMFNSGSLISAPKLYDQYLVRAIRAF